MRRMSAEEKKKPQGCEDSALRYRSARDRRMRERLARAKDECGTYETPDY